jgi:hypothetical protein
MGIDLTPFSVVNTRSVSRGVPISAEEKGGGTAGGAVRGLVVRWRRQLPDLGPDERDRLRRCLADVTDVDNGRTTLGAMLDRWAFFAESARGRDGGALRQCAADVLEVWSSEVEFRRTPGAAGSEPPAAAAFAAGPFDDPR